MSPTMATSEETRYGSANLDREGIMLTSTSVSPPNYCLSDDATSNDDRHEETVTTRVGNQNATPSSAQSDSRCSRRSSSSVATDDHTNDGTDINFDDHYQTYAGDGMRLGESVSRETASTELTENNRHQQSETNNGHIGHQSSSPTSSKRFMTGLTNTITRLSKRLANISLFMFSPDRCRHDDIPIYAFGHKRTLDKTWELMDKVVNCCQDPRMNLNNSPPFILEILPETYKHLKSIYTSQNFPHNDDGYSHVFLKNLRNRCELTLKLFKESKNQIFDENSDPRHKLTRSTLVFNHIYSELKAIYPNGQFVGERFLITKKESAGEFWRNNFGSRVLVDWKTFYHALQQVHDIDSSFFSLNALKQTIDLTCDDYISIFEFDVFTRLFQPWSTLLRNWQILAVTHPGYKAFLTYDELKARLQKHIDKPGSYVFRLSCTRLGQWAIGYVTQDGQILQTIVQNISLSQALTETKFYLYPDGKDEDPSLSDLCSGMASDERNVTVTEEQYEIYCGVGNSFQTCKICFENDKDIRVEPCNHLLCTSCLLAWQESEGQGCPYCRTEIKETVQITMDLPKTD